MSMSKQQKNVITALILTGVAQGLNLSFGALVGAIAQAYPHMDVDMIQMTVTISNLLAIAIGVVGGYLVVRYPEKHILLITLGIYFVFGIAPVFVGGFWPLMFFRFGSGVAVGLVAPVSTAFNRNNFDEKGRVMVNGIHASSIGIGMLIGSVTGGWLANYGYKIGLLPYFYCILPILFVSYKLPATTANYTGQTSRKITVNKSVQKLAVIIFCYAIASCSFETNIALHIGGKYAGSSSMSGIICGAYAVAQTTMGLVLGMLFRKIGRFTLPVVATFAAVGLTVISLFPANIPLLFFGAACCGASYSGFVAQIMAEANTLSTAASAAMAVSVIEIAKNIGKLISPLVLGRISNLLNGEFSTLYTFGSASVIMILTTATIYFIRIRQGRTQTGLK